MFRLQLYERSSRLTCSYDECICFSLSASILKPNPVTYVPDIKSICFANDPDFPLEPVPRRVLKAPTQISHELACHYAYAMLKYGMLFSPGCDDKISSDAII